MADQRIFFEQGSDETGDSGERGDNAGGVASIKPYIAGERAGEDIFNRPSENVRKRTEFLRAAGEEAKYLLDSNMRWLISAGDAAGLSGGPADMPGISTWDPVGGTFTTSNPIVVQPINTPSSDLQETKTYSFTDGLSQNATIAFTPLSYSDPAASGDQKRSYNGANLIKIVWEAVPEASLASATVPNYCNVAISGDPEHILTISIRDDDTTQMSNVSAALVLLQSDPGELSSMGLGFVIAGTVATSLLISEVAELDYRMKNTFEREVHYIPAASFVGFFAAPNALADGDTLSIYCADYVTDTTVQMTGRRESVPSNNTSTDPGTTTVAAGDMFITSSAAEVHKIPLSIPLCKRIGDDLYWMDGTVVPGAQTTFPVYFGEHGVTVDRGSAASSAMLAADSNVTGHWLFNDVMSVGTNRAVTTTNKYAIYAERRTPAPVGGNLTGLDLLTSVTEAVSSSVMGIKNLVEVGAVVTGSTSGFYTSVLTNEAPGAAVFGSITGLDLSSTGGTTPALAFTTASEFRTGGGIAVTKATEAGAMKASLDLGGGDLGTVIGYNLTVPFSTTYSDPAEVSELYGFKTNISIPTGVTVTDVYGQSLSVSSQAATSVYGSTISLDNSGVVTDLIGSAISVVADAGVTDIKGSSIELEVNAASASTTITGQYLYVEQNVDITDTVSGIHNKVEAQHDSYAAYGIRNEIRNVVGGVMTSAIYGIENVLQVNESPGSTAIAGLSELYLNSTNTVQVTDAWATRAIITTGGSTATTKATNAGAISARGNVSGGVFNEFSAVSAEVPGTTSTPAATVLSLVGVQSKVTVGEDVTATVAYGMQSYIDCSDPGCTIVTESAALRVDAISATYGAYVQAANCDVAGAALYVEATGTTVYGLKVTAPRNNITGTLSIGGTPYATLASLDINGAFATEKVQVDTADLGAAISAADTSLILLTGSTGAQTVTTINGGVYGQWLCVINTSTADVTFNDSGNISIGSANSTIINPGESMMFVYTQVGFKWREIYRT